MAAIEQELDKQEDERGRLWRQQSIQEEYDRKKTTQLIPMPDVAHPQVLGASEIEAIKKACLSEISRPSPNWNGKNTLAAIDDFVQFCTLLSKPENQIKVPSGQYIEREVTTRSFVDMEAEMAWALTNLAKYTAYIRYTEEQAGAHTVVKQQMRTYPLPPVPDGRDVSLLERHILDQTYLHYCKKRQDIEREISQRQKAELIANPNTSPSTQVESKEEPQSSSDDTPPPTSLSPGSTSYEPDQPPPVSVSASTSEARIKGL